MRAWKTFVKNVHEQLIKLIKGIINTNIWWASQFQGREFDVSIQQVKEFHKKGFTNIDNMWNKT